VVTEVLDEISTRIGVNETFAVLPEGVMLNYLSRRVNPTPYINFMPPELTMFGEDHMVATFATHPPDYILLVHKDTSEYGGRFFGFDYGKHLYSWIRTHYRDTRLFGAPPLQGSKFGILLLRKNSASESR
jgi:hypothetical protein